MAKYLLMDFGASRIKCAIYDTNIFVLNDIVEEISVPPVFYNDGRCEVPSLSLKEKFESLLNLYYNEKSIKFDGIFMCCEMHGFILVNKDNVPLTEYISWRDERCLNKNKESGTETYSHIKKELPLLGAPYITGMTRRCGTPIFNILHMVMNGEIKEDYKILTLPEWLSLVSNDSLNKVHETMFAGLGIYDIYKKEATFQNSTMLDHFRDGFDYPIPNHNDVTNKLEISGYWHPSNNISRVPIYTGVGDFQCAVLGAGISDETVVINLGTGSQIACLDKIDFEKLDKYPFADLFRWNDILEARPYFDANILSCITHIPSGRALDEYIGFLQKINSDKDYWKMLSELTLEDIDNSTLSFDLAIFNSAANYGYNGGINNIRENTFNINNYLSSLLKSYMEQYIRLIQNFKNTENFKILLSGGIPKKLPIIKEYLERELNKEVVLSKFNVDETLVGLCCIVTHVENGINYYESQELINFKLEEF